MAVSFIHQILYGERVLFHSDDLRIVHWESLMRTELHSLPIDQELFKLAFGRDVDSHDPYPLTTYLDRRTGEIDWVYEKDEDAEGEGIPLSDNRAMRERTKTAPDQYLELPGLTHGAHHDILKEFLNTECPEEAQGDYFGSIGGWIQSLDDDNVKHKYFDFRDRKIRQMGEDFLKGHGIQPLWK